LGESDKCLEHLREAHKIFIEFYLKAQNDCVKDYTRAMGIVAAQQSDTWTAEDDADVEMTYKKMLEKICQEERYLDQLIESIERRTSPGWNGYFTIEMPD
jgi:hypothetical protein